MKDFIPAIKVYLDSTLTNIYLRFRRQGKGQPNSNAIKHTFPDHERSGRPAISVVEEDNCTNATCNTEISAFWP